jgi:hypothetical protein
MSERSRLLVLDLLETYARERDIDVRLERDHDRDVWVCAQHERLPRANSRDGSYRPASDHERARGGRRQAFELTPDPA